MSVLLFQSIGNSTACLTACADPHQKNIEVRITDPLWEEFPDDRWIPRTQGQ